VKRTWRSLAEFYEQKPVRRYSREVDFGSWWREDDGPAWRVTYVAATGELYAVCLAGLWCDYDGQVELLNGQPISLAGAEGMLTGWADVCGDTCSLGWVRERLRPVRASTL
jgi:hypothetical protein